MIDFRLTKTDYLSYLACPEALWTILHHPEAASPLSEEDRFKLEMGNTIDRLAKGWFADTYLPQQPAFANIAHRFQYTVTTNRYEIRTDISLHPDEQTIIFFEVKASNEVKPEHLLDLAFQYMVLVKAGYSVPACYLVYLNKDYARGEELDLDALFQVLELTDQVLALLPKVAAEAQAAFSFLTQADLPIDPLHLCGGKANCIYRRHWLPELPPYHIFHISRIAHKKLQQLLTEDILDIRQVPAGFKLSAKQRTQVELAQSGEVHIDQATIRTVLGQLTFPLYFLDYETYSFPLPAQAGIRPYQQMIFQYSLHVIPEPGAAYRHYEYILREREEPVSQLMNHLRQHLPSGDEGTVIVWNEGFEKSRNRETADMLPTYAHYLHSVNERVYDLMVPFRDGHYLHPGFRGRHSIKAVLPVLCPDLSYKKLDIQNGSSAVFHWHQAVTGKYEPAHRETVFKQLLAYCHLDTWAMVRIWEEMGNI